MWLVEINKDRGRRRAINLAGVAKVSLEVHHDRYYLEVRWPYVSNPEEDDVTTLIGPFASLDDAERAFESVVVRGIRDADAYLALVIEGGKVVHEWID